MRILTIAAREQDAQQGGSVRGKGSRRIGWGEEKTQSTIIQCRVRQHGRLFNADRPNTTRLNDFWKGLKGLKLE